MLLKVIVETAKKGGQQCTKPIGNLTMFKLQDVRIFDFWLFMFPFVETFFRGIEKQTGLTI